MKKQRISMIVAAALLVVSLLAPKTFAGIPVIDYSNLAQSIQQVMHMLEQIEKLKSQLEVAKNQLSSIRGIRGLAGIINSKYDKTVGVDTNEIMRSEGLKSAAEKGLVGKTAELFDEGNRNAALRIGQSRKSLQQAQERFDELAKLVAKVNACPDQKDILDLQARIQAEISLLENEKIKLAMIQERAQAAEAVRMQKVRQMAVESTGELKRIDWK